MRLEGLGGWKRTIYCGEVTEEHVGKELVLMGWVQRRRDHGGLVFVDLRDREGVVQLVFSPEDSPQTHQKAHQLRNEFVIAVKGVVVRRPEGTVNPALKTGQVEVRVKELRILNESEVPPFIIEDETDAGEEIRLKYRYLDLRRPSLMKNLILRHRVCMSAREFLSNRGFIEIETPVLTKSTPEGARDFLVPSRLNPGLFYALPQSPQLFKQILMVAGFDRYFQITRCFRDEDLRRDRQPEFTQIDVEMSFIDREQIMSIMEELICAIFRDTLGVELTLPFPVLTYQDAICRYGTDTPDVRFSLELKEITRVVRGSDFKVFRDTIEKGGIVKAICVDGGARFSRKELDELTELAQGLGAKGLAWVKLTAEGWQSPIAKFLSEEEKEGIARELGAKQGDLLLFCSDTEAVVNHVLSRVRCEVAERMGLVKEGVYSFVWVVDFPMFEYDETEKRLVSIHHPFTAPRDEDMEKLSTSPLEVRAKAYDLTLNGEEIGGGSIRIHTREVQQRVFELLGISKKEAEEKFGFLLTALSYGAPPHGGIAFGLDRLVSIMAGTESIRDVIAFPKTQRAYCPMTGAPSEVDPAQLEELFIRVIRPRNREMAGET